MSRQPSIDFSDVNAKLGQLRRRAPDLDRKAREESATGITSEAQVLAPVRHGFLKDSDAMNEVNGKTEFGFTIDYAAAVHETHPTKSGFFRDAIRQNAARIVPRAVERAFQEMLRRLG